MRREDYGRRSFQTEFPDDLVERFVQQIHERDRFLFPHCGVKCGTQFRSTEFLESPLRFLARPVSVRMVESLEQSAKFTSRLADARSMFRPMITSRGIEPAAGDWTYFVQAERRSC